MNLECNEKMPDEETINKKIGKKVKTLYELARNKLFWEEYCCTYCNIIDFDKDWMRIHIKNIHDEFGKEKLKLLCKMCCISIDEHEVLYHEHGHKKSEC